MNNKIAKITSEMLGIPSALNPDSKVELRMTDMVAIFDEYIGENITLIKTGSYDEEYTFCVLFQSENAEETIKEITKLAIAYNEDIANMYKTRERLLTEYGYYKSTPDVTGFAYKNRGGKFPPGVDPQKHDPVLWEQRIEADEWNKSLDKKAEGIKDKIMDKVLKETSDICKKIEQDHPFMFKHWSTSHYYLRSAPVDFHIAYAPIFKVK